MSATASLRFLPVATEPMLRFETRAGDREIALLGVIEVGEIARCAPHGPKCYWRLRLPFCPQMGHTASLDHARAVMRTKIEQWVEAAGLMPAGRTP